LPVDAEGWVDKTCNTYGIQGGFYWYADANTTKNLKCGGATCEAKKPPWQSGAPGPGMCIKGTTTGSKDDWGAGIGLGLNSATSDPDSVKNAYNATENGVSGFDITLTGNTNAMDIRIGFGTSADGKTISPFIPVPDPAGKTVKLSGADQILIKNAVIPTDWKSTDPSPPDPTKIYDLQVQVATDTAKAGTAFELCVTAIKPTGGGSVGPTTTCKNTDGGTVSGTDVKDVGGFGIQANVNAASSGSCSVHAYSGSGCAAIDANVSGNLKGSGDAPAAYPSIIAGWQWGKGFHGSYSSPKKVSDLSSVKSTMSFTPPTGNKWDVAYDIWLDPSASISQPGGSSVEVMIWLDYSLTVTTNAIGTKTGTFTASDGSVWEVWTGNNSGGWKVVSYRRTPSTAAISNFDVLQFIKDSTTKGASNSMYVLGIQAGFELFDVTGGGSISNYTLSIN
jgi:hypothetical protein